jgi:LysM repeat protein
MRLPSSLILLFLIISSCLSAQKLTNADYSAYIEKYKAIAIKEMQLYKIPASITLAQGMIESGCGKSVLAVDTKNHFGIKCQKEWTGETYYYDDDKAQECFRKYKSVEESFRDHSIFLSTRKRYAALFELPLNDYKGWAYGLKQAGYATNPEYPNILIRLIENNKLYLFDNPSAKPEEVAITTPTEKPVPKVKQSVSKEKRTFKWGGRILFYKNYKMPEPSTFDVLYTTEKGRKVYENSEVPFIFAQKGDTWYTIAKEFKIFIFQVYRRNDLKESDPIEPGQILYLKSKKKKNSDGTYKVKKGDSLYSISQEKCIKIKYLLKYNDLQPDKEPDPGFVMKLTK